MRTPSTSTALSKPNLEATVPLQISSLCVTSAVVFLLYSLRISPLKPSGNPCPGTWQKHSPCDSRMWQRVLLHRHRRFGRNTWSHHVRITIIEPSGTNLLNYTTSHTIILYVILTRINGRQSNIAVNAVWSLLGSPGHVSRQVTVRRVMGEFREVQWGGHGASQRRKGQWVGRELHAFSNSEVDVKLSATLKRERRQRTFEVLRRIQGVSRL